MIFCTTGGGTGSTHLIKALRKIAPCAARPDVCLEKNGKGGVLKNLTLDSKPSKSMRKIFAKRTGTKAVGNTIREMFERYLWLHGGFVVLNGNLFQLPGPGFRRPPIFYLVRHPLHGMVSWYQNRHPEMLDAVGGDISSRAAVEQYARFWNNAAPSHFDYIDDDEGELIRYECVKSDVQQEKILPFVRKAFDGWNMSKRHHGVLTPAAEAYLRQLTINRCRDLEIEWDI